jgi:hypothetical protein
MTTLFDYELIGTGWAKVTVGNNEKVAEFEVSYLSDPLSDLIESLIKLLNKKSTAEEIIFPEEPGEHSLILALGAENKLQIDIFWNDEWEQISTLYNTNSNKERIYSDSDTLINFSKAVQSCIQRLFNKHELKEYKNKWHLYNFPEGSFSELSSILQQYM